MQHEPKHLSKRDLAVWKRNRKIRRTLKPILIVLLGVLLVATGFIAWKRIAVAQTAGEEPEIPAETQTIIHETKVVEVEEAHGSIDNFTWHKVSMQQDRDYIDGSIVEEDLARAISMSSGAVRQEQLSFEEPIQVETPKAKISAYEPSESYYYQFSDEDKKYMIKAVIGEAGGEPFQGQVAVAAVIINRLYSNIPYFNRDSVYSIITQPYQFVDIRTISDDQIELYPSCVEAVEAACKGWDPTRQVFADGALYFFNPEGLTESQLAERQVLVQVIGHHSFHVDFSK